MKKSNFFTKLIDIFKNVDQQPLLVYAMFLASALLIIAVGKTDDIIIPIVVLLGTSLLLVGIYAGVDKDIDKLWSEHRRKRGQVQEKYVVGDRIKELINKINSMRVRDGKIEIGSADITWQLETRGFRTEDILENYELPSLVELQKLSELFFFRSLKVCPVVLQKEVDRAVLCNMLYILTGDKSYLSEDCRPESAIIRKTFEEYEAAYNAECYELLASYERSLT